MSVAAGAATATTLPTHTRSGSPVIGNLLGGTIVLILLIVLWRQVRGRRKAEMGGIFSFGRPLSPRSEPKPPKNNEPFRDDRL